MAIWLNSKDLENIFLVSKTRLENYARRGNLAFKKAEEEMLYNMDQVSLFFLRKDGKGPKTGLGSSNFSLGNAVVGQKKVKIQNKKLRKSA